jgi:hypothetical protein
MLGQRVDDAVWAILYEAAPGAFVDFYGGEEPIAVFADEI